MTTDETAAVLPPLPRAEQTWSAREASTDVVDALAQALHVRREVAQVMVGRGVVQLDQGRDYLEPKLQRLPDPFRLMGMDAAVARVLFAIERNETIGIFGDYDVDGVTSTTLLREFLIAVGASTAETIPDRLIEGYGLSRGGVDRLQAAGARLLITVDCGVTAHEEIAYANACGLDVVVIDHHTVPVTLPAAVAVINPHRDDCTRGSEMLCAVGVTFNLVAAVRRELAARGHFSALKPAPDLKQALDLVALGTVADVVPLVGENRILVSAGLKLLRERKRLGMRALLDVAGVESADIGASTLGFQLGPRVNAAGRLGDAMQAVRLLSSNDTDEAARLAQVLDTENAARKDIEKAIVHEAIAQVTQSRLLREAPVVVVYNPSWHPGVVGIVASRLVEQFGRPAVVIGEGGRGSGRSIEKFHLYNGLHAVKDTLVGFGGHAHAAGVRVAADHIDRFRDALINHAAALLTREDQRRVLWHDGEMQLGAVDVGLCRDLLRLAPFGRKNPEPAFVFGNFVVRNTRVLAGGHLRLQLSASSDGRPITAIAFGLAEREAMFARGGARIVATPELNTFRGDTNVQLRVRDVQC